MQTDAVTETPSEIDARIAELQRGFRDDLDRAECAALRILSLCGIGRTEDSILYRGNDQWVAWAADSIVFAVRELRAYENPEHRYYQSGQCLRCALRAWGQVQEYRGRNGGFLTASLSDHAVMLQNRLEALIAPR